MFQINLSKLSDFDTQVMTLITLSPGSWQIGTAPRLVCRHEQLGWFHRHWIFGVQPMITTPGSSRVRSLTWRGQILLRRKVREIKRSAVDLNVPESIAPAPTVGASNVPLSAGLSGMAAGGMVGRGSGMSTAAATQAMQAQQSNLMRQMVQTMGPAGSNHMAAPAQPAPRPAAPRTLMGYTMKDMLDAGCPPEMVAAGFKESDPEAVGKLIDFAAKHM